MSGVGESKLAKYGQQVLDVLASGESHVQDMLEL